jgi:iron complex outermembrane receptor protein
MSSRNRKQLVSGVALLGIIEAGVLGTGLLKTATAYAQDATGGSAVKAADTAAADTAAEDAGPQAEKPAARLLPIDLQEITVVGTRIGGARAAEALPVTVVSANEIQALGAVSGDDLLRSVPSMGNVTFNPTNGQQTNNSARGDISSIDLRGAGIGDTLVLLNGRRMVEYPTSQSKGGVPLIAFNAESLPIASMDRLEVLRDGAGAIYGSDAVAGVVNAVTETSFDGVKVDNEYGGAQDTHLRQNSTAVLAGHDFAGGAGNVTVSLDLTQRSAELSGDEPYTATQDLRPLFANDPGYSGSAVPDGRGNQSSWPALVALGIKGPIKQGTTSITTAAGSFHIQPDTLTGCLAQLGNDLCIGSGSVPYTSTANSLRYDAAENNSLTDSPAVHREIGELNAHYDLSSGPTLYSELDYYHASTDGLTTQGTSLVPIGVPASNYYNPFGPVVFANGTVNPNRLPNLTNVPAAGIPVTLATYRFNDLGPDPVNVDSYQSRFLVGARGTLGVFDWDSALLYGEAQDTDVSGSINSEALAQQLALSTPDAYNPFNGSCLNGAGGGDCTPSAQAALKAIEMSLKRVSKSTLTNADFKLTTPALFDLPGGGLGMATGVEARRETHEDIRAPAVNGSEPFTDPVTGLVSASSATGVNVTPSTSGSRNVYSAYVEFAVPVISREMEIPLVQAINLQVAGRYENYSDFGSVAKPKVALAWDVVDGVRLRGSYQQGFKAPNLETTAPFTYARAQAVTDYYRCEADLLTHKIATFGACTDTVTVAYNESGNPGLKPETSTSYSFGLVFEPKFLPEGFGNLTVSVDRWNLKQLAIVGVVGVQNLSVQDYLNRVQGGSGAATVIRAAPTADDIAEFAGSGLAPAGVITQVNDQFENLQPQTISGIDYGIIWRKRTAHLGAYSFNVDATTLDKFYQPPSLAVQSLYTARGAGLINAATPLATPGNELEALGNPRVKATTALTWVLDPVQVGASVVYTGKTKDTNFLSTTGVPWPVASMTVVNLYGQYSFAKVFQSHDVHMRLGVRNLFNRSPPLESDGYNGALYVPYGRYLYASVGVLF